MIKTLSISLCLLSFSVTAFSATVKNETLQRVSAKYRSAKLVEMNVEKSVKSELLGKTTKYVGKIFLANGKFRWENTKPEKTLLVFDGKTIWSEQTPPAELGGNVQVARGVVDRKTKSHILISSLVGADLQKHFKVLNEKTENGVTKIEVAPANDDLTIKSLTVSIDPKENLMKQISYKDDIGNLTTMDFSQINFLKTENSKLFKYQPPKGAQVTDL